MLVLTLVASVPALAQSPTLVIRGSRSAQLVGAGAVRLSEAIGGQALDDNAARLVLGQLQTDAGVAELLDAIGAGEVDLAVLRQMHPELMPFVERMDALFADTIREQTIARTCPIRRAARSGGMCGLTGFGHDLQAAFQSSLPRPGAVDLGTALPDGLENAGEEMADMARTVVRACRGDEACARAALSGPEAEAWWQRVLGNTCIGRNPTALKAMAFHYGLFITGLVAAYGASDAEEFPFDLLAAGILIEAVWQNQACRNIFEGQLGSAHTGGKKPSFGKAFVLGYREYLKWVPLDLVVYPAASMAEDAIRGEDVMTEEKLKQYLAEGIYIFVWDLGFALPRNLLIVDPLYLKAFPKMRGAMHSMFEKGLVGKLAMQNGKLGVRLNRAATLPGAGAELAGRWTVGAINEYLFLEGRDLGLDVLMPVLGAPREKDEAPSPE